MAWILLVRYVDRWDHQGSVGFARCNLVPLSTRGVKPFLPSFIPLSSKLYGGVCLRTRLSGGYHIWRLPFPAYQNIKTFQAPG